MLWGSGGGWRPNFNSKKKDYFGVDLGSVSIKAAVFDLNLPTGYKFGQVPTPPGSMEDGAIRQSELLAQSLQDLLKISDIPLKKAVTMISGKNVLTRFVKLPQMSTKEMAQTMKWEMEKYLPLSTNQEYVTDYQILGGIVEEGSSKINVLLAGVPRKIISELYQMFQIAGIKLLAVEIEAVSLGRNITTDETVIYLDMGSKAANFSVYSERKLIFSRYIFLEDESWHQSSISHTCMGSFVNEVKRSLDYCRSYYPPITPRQLVLIGGRAKLKGLNDILQRELQISVAHGLADLPQIDPLYAVAVGLAKRERI